MRERLGGRHFAGGAPDERGAPPGACHHDPPSPGYDSTETGSTLESTIRILALGSGAGNALNAMVRAGADPADFIAANTDVQDLKRTLAATRLQIGKAVARGLGAGGDIEVGRAAVAADRSEIAAALTGADLVILLAALGGGTGGGAVPVVVEIAASVGAVVVPVVTTPFKFEGRSRKVNAEAALVALRVVAGDRLILVKTEIPPPDSGTTMSGLFALSDMNVAAAVREVLAAARGEVEQASEQLIALRGGLS